MLRNLPQEASATRPAEIIVLAHLLLRMKSGIGVLLARKLSVISNILQHFNVSLVSLTHILENSRVRTELKGDREMRDSCADFPPPITMIDAPFAWPLALCIIRFMFAWNSEE